jgi:hypothetical protein
MKPGGTTLEKPVVKPDGAKPEVRPLAEEVAAEKDKVTCQGAKEEKPEVKPDGTKPEKPVVRPLAEEVETEKDKVTCQGAKEEKPEVKPDGTKPSCQGAKGEVKPEGAKVEMPKVRPLAEEEEKDNFSKEYNDVEKMKMKRAQAGRARPLSGHTRHKKTKVPISPSPFPSKPPFSVMPDTQGLNPNATPYVPLAGQPTDIPL